MDAERIFADAALRQWKSWTANLEALITPLTDAQLESPVAPGRNRMLYLVGHLAAVHDQLLPMLGIAERRHPELDETFLTNADSHAHTPFTAAQVKEMLAEVNAALLAGFTAWTPADWLLKHAAVSDDDFAREPHRNRFSVVLNRTAHLATHYGQMLLAKPAV